MLTTVKILTVIVYFILPINLVFVQFSMFFYLIQAFQSGLLGIIYGFFGIIAGVFLLFSAGFKENKVVDILSVLALLVMAVPATATFINNNVHADSITIAYHISLLVFMVGCLFLSGKKLISPKKI